MTVEEILKLLNNPASIEDALKEAAKLPFYDNDLFLFNQKRLQYHAGMSDYETVNWISQMKSFLYAKFGDNHSNQITVRNYQSDDQYRWHYLDKKKFRQKLREICRSTNPVKVILVESNIAGFSHHIPDMLLTFIKADQKNLSKYIAGIKGDMERLLYLDDIDTLHYEWTEFMQSCFDLSRPYEQISEEFKEKKFNTRSYIIVQRVSSCGDSWLDYLKVYSDFWNTLMPERPLFLCFHVPENALPRDDASLTEFLCCYSDQYDPVEKDDFVSLCKVYPCYKVAEVIFSCEPMSFKDAVEKLQFCG